MQQLEHHLEEAEQSLDEGDPEGALEAADAALAQKPECAEAWYLRGLALGDLERADDARQAVERALGLDPQLAPAAYALADLVLFDRGEVHRAIAICDEHLRRELDDELYSDFLNLKASALCELGEFEAAMPVYERAAQLCPARADPGGVGWCHFELCAFESAEAALLDASHGPGHANPATHFYLAATLERLGDPRRAKKHFRIAARLDPEAYFVPIRIPEDDFAALVEEAVAGLSEAIAARLHNVAVAVEPWPPPAELDGAGLSPLIVGMFRGPSLAERSTEDPWSEHPGQIMLYQRNLEYTCQSRDEMVEQIRITLWHEVGHFLGLTEEELHDRGLG